ncbi:hypothetical protein FRB96_001725 [Tulasnella sp. 330]|nr:hypothetical protein FRB96_001725 [Tulasnella sp. 330]
MKSTISATALLSLACFVSAAPSREVEKRAYPTGIDVSSYQGASPSWSGSSFAYIKATEGTTYTNPDFASQYNGAYNAGLIRGSYHFAHPDSSTGAAQASYFVKNGGGWSADGKTLPGALDIEYNPSGAECYGLTAAAMVSWIQSFSSEYNSLTGRADSPVDEDYWNGTAASLKTFALG